MQRNEFRTPEPIVSYKRKYLQFMRFGLELPMQTHIHNNVFTSDGYLKDIC